jgi:hypothetical protein
MQRTIKAIRIFGALLALTAVAAPKARACSVPPASAWSMTLSLPPANPARPALEAVAGQTGAPIVGLWFIRFYSGNVVVDEAFDAWTSDGLEILNDFTNPVQDNVCLGVWTQTGQTYKLKHPSWTFDTAGNLTGTAVISETLMVGADSNSFSGSYIVDLYDTSGSPVGQYQGAVKAIRIVSN